MTPTPEQRAMRISEVVKSDIDERILVMARALSDVTDAEEAVRAQYDDVLRAAVGPGRFVYPVRNNDE